MRLLQCKKSLKSCTTCLKVKDHSKSLFLLRHSFALNIGPDDKDITMHINPRFNAHGDENTVVCNSYEGGNWCEEQREGCFPFQLGEEFKVRGPAHVCVCPVRPCVCSLQHTSSFLATPDGKCVSLHQYIQSVRLLVQECNRCSTLTSLWMSFSSSLSPARVLLF